MFSLDDWIKIVELIALMLAVVYVAHYLLQEFIYYSSKDKSVSQDRLSSEYVNRVSQMNKQQLVKERINVQTCPIETDPKPGGSPFNQIEDRERKLKLIDSLLQESQA